MDSDTYLDVQHLHRTPANFRLVEPCSNILAIILNASSSIWKEMALLLHASRIR